MTKLTLHPKRCERLVALLSLDIVRPLYQAMGLGLSETDSDKLLSLLRDTITARGGAYLKIPVPDDFSEMLVERLRRGIGKSAQETFLSWAVYDYVDIPADHPHRQAWTTILSWCGARSDKWSTLGLPTEIAEKLRQEFRNQTTLHDVEQYLGEMSSNQMSDWDQKVFEQRKSNDDAWEPISSVEVTIYQVRVIYALDYLVSHLSKDHLDIFLANAQSIGSSRDLITVKKLKKPDDLREAAD